MSKITPAPNPSTDKRRRLAVVGLVSALLLIHAALAIDTLRRKSVTVDEVGHLPAGISYWQQRTFELYHHNPPLVKQLAAIPALAAGPTVDYSKSWSSNQRRGMPLSPWAFGWEFMYANAARYQTIYVLARLPVVGLSVLAGVVIFLWSRELFGMQAGLLGLTLWTFCPNAIAHAGMVTTDMGATSLGFVATYFFWRYLKCPILIRAGIAGIVLGLAELTKFSLLMLYLLWPAIWLIWILLMPRRSRTPRPNESKGREHSQGQRSTHSPDEPATQVQLNSAKYWLGACHLVFIVALSVLIINWGYWFEGSFRRLGEFQFLSRSLTRPRTLGAALLNIPTDHPWAEVLRTRRNRFQGTWLAQLRVPLPRHYVEGFDEQKLESEGIGGQGYPVFLRGELRRTGWWWYYFYALAIKVPIGTWLITIASLAAAVLRPAARSTIGNEILLLAPVAVVLLVMSFLTDINLGLRYVLPIFPFWFVLVSRAAVWLKRLRSIGSIAVLLPLVWNIGSCGWIHPHHLAYFNETIGGPKNGYRSLIDSNLDWGQDLLALEAWLKQHRPGVRVGLAYFGNVDPSILAASGRGINFSLAHPAKLDDLRLVAMQPESVAFEARNRWVMDHERELSAWAAQQQRAGQPVQLNDHPSVRKIAFEQIDVRDGPQPGLFAISANFVAGLPFRLRDQSGTIWNAGQDAYGYFRKLKPVNQVGYSIHIYEISEDQAAELRSKMGL